jgi:hypothetical protein
MLWIGGAPGAGKSTLAWQLSRSMDLPLHPVDLWVYDHQARRPAAESLDELLARGPEAAADAFETGSRERLGLVLDDIAARDLGPVPALVEGPQLMPELATRLPGGYAVWLLPDPERTRLARQERLAEEQALADGPTAARRDRAEGLLRRDAVLAGRIQQAADRAGRPVIAVPAAPDWATIAAAIEAALSPALREVPRLAEGPALSAQRRRENAVAVRQGRLWAAADELARLPSYPFACECGTSRCRAAWRVTPDDYETRAAGQALVLHRGRVAR